METIAKYIWTILKSQPAIIMSWGVDPATVRALDRGLECHVQDFLHTGFLQITLNEGTDLFEITLLSENRETVKFINGIYFDCLVDTIDRAVEKCDNYEQRVSEFLKEGQIW